MSRPWRARGPGPGRPDDDGLQIAPLLERIEPGRIAVSECLSHRLEQLQPRVLFVPEPLQVHLERLVTRRHTICQEDFKSSSGLLAVLG
ncbi:hypothetical protein CYJ18_05910 [Actinomyces naeslundii]|nr:hypothetical protein BKH04_01095 [Actinomyces naeslundii]PKY95418.1 hypothetical protein CYJ18_05910 [Actinomyces naeslundii]